MSDKEKTTPEQDPKTREEEKQPENTAYPEPEENWAHETVRELLDFWEEQGVYIRE